MRGTLGRKEEKYKGKTGMGGAVRLREDSKRPKEKPVEKGVIHSNFVSKAQGPVPIRSRKEEVFLTKNVSKNRKVKEGTPENPIDVENAWRREIFKTGAA